MPQHQKREGPLKAQPPEENPQRDSSAILREHESHAQDRDDPHQTPEALAERSRSHGGRDWCFRIRRGRRLSKGGRCPQYHNNYQRREQAHAKRPFGQGEEDVSSFSQIEIQTRSTIKSGTATGPSPIVYALRIIESAGSRWRSSLTRTVHKASPPATRSPTFLCKITPTA